MPDSIKDYLKSVEQLHKTNLATEHTYRAALQALISSQQPGLTVINEKKRIECGAPDLTILKNDFTIGYIEAKDIGVSLDDAQKSDQLKRYLAALDNLILTDYLEFRWFVKGEHRRTVRIATPAGPKLSKAANLAELDNLLIEFLAQSPEKLASSQEVAQRMAQLTHMIRNIVVEAFAQGQASHMLKDLRKALAQTLLPGLNEPGRVAEFADIYAQTIAYGLFAARCNHKGNEPFKRATAAAEIPKTNPFLRRLFTEIAGPDLADEPYFGFVIDLVQLLHLADMEAILTDFGKRTKQEDPIVHFYETFLATYDPKLRELRGVYYTPTPVVSYIVRSVDHLLKTRFNLPAGLTDTSKIDHQGRQLPKMLLLDPAAGTGTFLYGVIDHIRNQFRTQNNVGMWSGYVKDHLLNKLYGFELLMVPYAVAHFKLALQLAGQDLNEAERPNWAYDFGSEERLKIYLTNTLEEIEHEVQTLFGLMRVITEEAKAAAAVKQELPILVVMGNPPYSGHSANASWKIDAAGKRVPTFIGDLVKDYYFVDGQPLGERNPKWLQDDYVKFIRWGQWRIEQTGAGILAFITNHGYLDNPTFRGMRQHLLNTFTDIYVLNLHGNAKKKETAPDGGKDENVFDIQQGVAIGIFIKEPGKTGPARVHHADLWGERAAKYKQLAALDINSTKWTQLDPQIPFHLFTPQDIDLLAEYNQFWPVTQIYDSSSVGIVTARDDLTIHWSRNEVWQTINDFASLPVETARSKYDLGKDARDWKVHLAQSDIKSSGPTQEKLTEILYRPFDLRSTYYTSQTRGFMCMPRPEVMPNMLKGQNLGLITTRQTRDQWDAFVTRQICGHKSCAAYDINFLFPLYLYPDPTQLFNMSPWPAGKAGRTPNLTPYFVQQFEQKLNLAFVSDGQGDLQTTFGPEDIFYYIYTIFHSPIYRDRYAEFLKIDFPRVPLTSDRQLFAALVPLGAELVKLHLLEQVPPSLASYPVKGNDIIIKGHPKYNEAAQRVYINLTQYFEGVPPAVWDFYVGGYQVCDKWLKDRRERKLTYQDLTHYQQIVAALGRTIELMEEIDNTIPDWPIE